MNTNKQEASCNVHLRKAKKAINFILVLSIFSLLTLLIPGRISQSLIIQLFTVIGLYLSGRFIFKYPIFGVLFLGAFLVFYLYGWYNLITSNVIPKSLAISPGNFTYYLIIFIRALANIVVLGGFYFAIKGMVEKEQFEKRYDTLDEDEMEK